MDVKPNMLLPEGSSVKIEDETIFPLKHERDNCLNDTLQVCGATININDIELKTFIKNDKIEHDENSTVIIKTEPSVLVYMSISDENIKIEDEINAENKHNVLFCNQCEEYYRDYCAKCDMLLYILDRNILENTYHDARLEIPKDILEIRESFEHFGIFSLKLIPTGVKFGPFCGLNSSIGSWKVKRGKFIVEDVEANRLSWMWYINHAQQAVEHNLLVFQHDNRIYYRSVQEIQKGDQLLVYFGEEYEDNLNNNVEVDFIPSMDRNVQDVFACTTCCLGFSSIEYLTVHKTICTDGIVGNTSNREIIQCPYCKIYLEQWEYVNSHGICCRTKYVRWSEVSPQNQMVVSGNRNKRQRKTYKCLRCNYKAPYKAVVKDHANGHYQIKALRCRLCYRRFKRKKHFKLHMGKIHANIADKETLDGFQSGCQTKSHKHLEVGNFEVQKCNRMKHNHKTNRKETLSGMSGIGRRFKCAKCNYRTRLKDSIKRHHCTYVIIRHIKNINRNLREKNSYPDGRDYVIDVKPDSNPTSYTHVVAKRFKCMKCTYSSNFKGNLQRHSHTHEMVKRLKCSKCDYVTNSKTSLERHSYSHEMVKRFNCSKCDYVTSMKCDFLNHSYVHEAVKRFSCSKCDYATNFKANLQRHSYTHEPVNRFKCSLCDYETNAKSGFVKHTFVHEPKERFKCSKCDYVTNFRRNLTFHRYKHEPEKRFKCAKCDFETNFKSSVERHSYTHGTVKQLKCTICDYATNDKSNLKSHLYVHETARPFKCSDCNYATTCNDYLRKHRYTHATVKRFKCSICDYETNRRSDLSRHSYTHEELKHLKCPKCSYATNRKINLENHLRSHETVKRLE